MLLGDAIEYTVLRLVTLSSCRQGLQRFAVIHFGAQAQRFYYFFIGFIHTTIQRVTWQTSLPYPKLQTWVNRGVFIGLVFDKKKTHFLPFLTPVSVTITVRGSDLASGFCDSVKRWKMFVWKQFSKEHRDRWWSRLSVLGRRNMQKWRRERLEGVFSWNGFTDCSTISLKAFALRTYLAAKHSWWSCNLSLCSQLCYLRSCVASLDNQCFKDTTSF